MDKIVLNNKIKVQNSKNKLVEIKTNNFDGGELENEEKQ